MQKIIYLFRHGETDWNRKGINQSRIDIELNDTGLEQAKTNAEMLKNKGIQYIYSSPLKRAYKTGEILSQVINVGIEVVQDLTEFNTGITAGKTNAEILKIISKEDCEKFATKDGLLDSRISPDAETKREVRERAHNCILNICKKIEYNIIGISTHEGFIREFLRSLDYENDSGIKNCEVVKAEFDGKDLKILERFKFE